MDVAPSSARRWYVSAKTCGVGRDVVTMVYSRSAAATCAAEMSRPSTKSRPPTTTWSGTTSMPCRSTTSLGR